MGRRACGGEGGGNGGIGAGSKSGTYKTFGASTNEYFFSSDHGMATPLRHLAKGFGEEPLDADGKGRRMKLIHVLTLEEIDQSPVDEERILGLLSLSGTTNVRDNMLEVKNSRDE